MKKTPQHREEIRKKKEATIEMILFSAVVFVGGFAVAMVLLPAITG